MLELDVEDIHLWCVFYEQINDPLLLARYDALLSPAERERMQRFHFAKDRHCFLVSRVLVRTALSRYSSVAPQQWSFHASPHGKPRIANGELDAQDLSFNLSHTQGMVVLGLTRRMALGVDVENMAHRTAPLDVAERFFSRAEVAQLHALPVAQRQERFFRLWTLKESYIKARGLGLSIPLDRFGFDFTEEGVAKMSIDRELNDDSANWRFWQCRPSADHLLAVCSAHGGRAGRKLVVKSIVPLTGAESLIAIV
ncbi:MULTISPECIES: 4'-phosphopantetheinyl transferase family protein [unclassified Janthinobacterium]|uniref:4'-phosphopantetheinyl transferase family protein n=1 Tax=unclassified Janthinobacterium TaxID=2610881 RepID=UPI000368539D|nr:MULTISPECIES: 4'-phosphopantetheinyl transferase superfamily protein [unclassified Janthinobacterium]MEC5160914.1 4'-phosphopantetheinyl transferase [Janthinobacterium sp. CG_S6]